MKNSSGKAANQAVRDYQFSRVLLGQEGNTGSLELPKKRDVPPLEDFVGFYRDSFDAYVLAAPMTLQPSAVPVV